MFTILCPPCRSLVAQWKLMAVLNKSIGNSRYKRRWGRDGMGVRLVMENAPRIRSITAFWKGLGLRFIVDFLTWCWIRCGDLGQNKKPETLGWGISSMKRYEKGWGKSSCGSCWSFGQIDAAWELCEFIRTGHGGKILAKVWACFRCTEVPILEFRTAIPHEKLHRKFASWLQESFPLQAPAHWTPWALEVAQLKRGNERLGRGSCWIPKSALKVARFLPQDLRYWSVFPIFWYVSVSKRISPCNRIW